jgi:hypothetical protein
MSGLIKSLFLITLLVLSQRTFAATCTQNNNVLNGWVGLDSSAGTIYAKTTSSSNECSCTNVRFTQANTNTQMALSILLSAKMAGKAVRVDLLDSNNCNSAYRVYIE